MNRFIILTLTLTINTICHSQIKFDPGYFIDNNDERTDCLIKNDNPRSNPSKFSYKLTSDSEVKICTIDSIKEFSIDNCVKYMRNTVDIDRTGYDFNSITPDMHPHFTPDTLFLKVLIEGKASLYSYIEGALERYFFSKDHLPMSQLIYKQHKTPSRRLRYNWSFRSQLFENLQCNSLSYSDIEEMNYIQSDLETFFIRYNECVNSEFKHFTETKNKGILSFTLKTGMNYSSLWVNNVVSDDKDAIFETKWHPRIGVEMEYLIPFWSNKWALIIDPGYYYYHDIKPVIRVNAYAKYQVIELPVGFRHYFYLTEKSKVFVNASAVFLGQLGSSIEYDESRIPLEIFSKFRANFGCGYNLNNKYYFEFKFCNSRNFTEGFLWTSNYRYFALLFGYSFANNKP
ncbi:MAG: hypothetical protein KAS71_07695 [Bacteroidales bacterium]|nr:hypothetical protein [Bacteroidales bacterium]